MKLLPLDTLRELTGLKQPAAVRRWLDQNGIKYLLAADGWPRVEEGVILGLLGASVPPPSNEPRLRLRNG